MNPQENFMIRITQEIKDLQLYQLEAICFFISGLKSYPPQDNISFIPKTKPMIKSSMP
jgi:hypothetical protein